MTNERNRILTPSLHSPMDTPLVIKELCKVRWPPSPRPLFCPHHLTTQKLAPHLPIAVVSPEHLTGV